jgi:hypothetical protein
MTTIYILFGIIIFLILGRICVNFLKEKNFFDIGSEFIMNLIYLPVLFFYFIMTTGDAIYNFFKKK